MKTFTYAITDAAGIHARPAGLLVKEAKKFESKISVAKGARKSRFHPSKLKSSDRQAQR